MSRGTSACAWRLEKQETAMRRVVAAFISVALIFSVHAFAQQLGPNVLWLVLAINAAMFAIEIGAGLAAGSASLQADALDFLGDAGNYAISLFVVGMTLRYRATAALAKGATMAAFGLWVISITAWHAWYGTLPHAFTMGAVGLGALVANAVSFALL